MPKKSTLILDTPPFDKIGAFTEARIALAAVMDDIDVSVVLMEDGMYATLTSQETTQFFKTVQVLQDFQEAGGRLLVCGLCLTERGIPKENVINGAEIIDIHKLVNTMVEGDQTVFFGA